MPFAAGTGFWLWSVNRAVKWRSLSLRSCSDWSSLCRRSTITEPTKLVPVTGNAAAPTQAADPSGDYVVLGARTAAQRSAVGGTGAVVNAVDHAELDVTATRSEVEAIKKLGYQVKPAPLAATERAQDGLDDFPPADSTYHNYAEMTAAVNRTKRSSCNLILLLPPTLTSPRPFPVGLEISGCASAMMVPMPKKMIATVKDRMRPVQNLPEPRLESRHVQRAAVGPFP